MANRVRPIVVSEAARHELERLQRASSTPAGLSRRVRAVLLMAQGLPGVSMGLVVAAEPGTGPAEAAMGMGLPTPVSALPGGSQGGVLDGGPVVPVPPPQKELSQRPGQLPGVSGLPGGGGHLDRTEQHGVFDLEPGPRLPMVG